MSEDMYTKWKDIIKKIARFVAYDYPDVEVADLEQDLWVEVMERSLSNPYEDTSIKFLRKYAKSRANQYRAEHLILSPQFNYRVSDVRRILDTVFDHNDWVEAATREEESVGTRSGREPSYNLDEVIITHSDVKRAWALLPHQYKVAIFERYGLGDIPDSTSSEGRKLRRAETRLTEMLNTYHPKSNHQGPGSRKIIGNALARYIIDNDL